MLYEDKKGNLIHPEKVESMSLWEIQEKGLHVYDEATV